MKRTRDAFSEKCRKERHKIQEFIWSDRYQFLSEIGRGNQSRIFLVRHQQLGEYRAVKCISKEADSSWQIREAKLLNHLKHPRIPIVYDIEEDDDFYYIIEEYVEGESLEALMLQSSFLTQSFIYDTIWEICEVLSYLHHIAPVPVIYQDLKAEHVIIGKKGVKLIDFGIASYLNETEGRFQNYGTPEYTAPEKRELAEINVGTDIYSLGKLLGRLVLAGEEKSLGLLYISQKATHPMEKQRYASIEEFQKALGKAKEDMQSEKNPVYQKHLLRKIIVAGSRQGTGVTHIAVSFTQYLNSHHIPAVYQEKNPNNDMRKTVKTGKKFAECGGLYRRGDFLGLPLYGEGVEISMPKDRVLIIDWGNNLKRAGEEEADLFLLVAGSREWERDSAKTSFKSLSHEKNLIFISNYGDRKQARRYAKEFCRPVYCFPLDKDPFTAAKEKDRIFGKLLQREGGDNQRNLFKNRWHFRKHKRNRYNPFGYI
ncbi:MAG: serine/threonine protein kinase, partial [Lachnospiraceae bacterium]|nr:serine/threonine protein kinase [Lachnospiraceae bacterium]